MAWWHWLLLGIGITSVVLVGCLLVLFYLWMKAVEEEMSEEEEILEATADDFGLDCGRG